MRFEWDPRKAELNRKKHGVDFEEAAMSRNKEEMEVNDLREEYRPEDLGRGVRGKYLRAYQKGSNLVLLSPDVAEAFPTSESVNEALRSLLELARKSARVKKRPAAPRKRASR